VLFSSGSAAVRKQKTEKKKITYHWLLAGQAVEPQYGTGWMLDNSYRAYAGKSIPPAVQAVPAMPHTNCWGNPGIVSDQRYCQFVPSVLYSPVNESPSRVTRTQCGAGVLPMPFVPMLREGVLPPDAVLRTWTVVHGELAPAQCRLENSGLVGAVLERSIRPCLAHRYRPGAS
jgi:hypothetical protein